MNRAYQIGSLDTNDPDVPKLRVARAELARAVELDQITPQSACNTLGKFADNLVRNRELSRPRWSKKE